MSNHETGEFRSSVSERYISPLHEAEYCQEHGFELIRFPNGATLLGGNRMVQDLQNTEAQFNFPSGSFFDPPGKAGIHHFLEHMVANRSLAIGRELDVRVRAMTGPMDLRFIYSGSANPSVKGYGFWNILPYVRQAFYDPLSDIPDPEKLLRSEKMVLVHEDLSRSLSTRAFQFALSDMLHPLNPIQASIRDKNDDLDAISVDDLQATSEAIIIPDGLVAGVFSEGAAQNPAVFAAVREIIGGFPRTEREKLPQYARQNMGLLNPDFSPGKVYIYQSDIAHRVDINLFWILQEKANPLVENAGRDVEHLLHGTFFNYIRNMGSAYDPGVEIHQFGDKAFFDFSFSTSKLPVSTEAAIDTIYPRMFQHMLQDITAGAIDNSFYQAKMRHQAVPTLIKNRYTAVLEDLIETGMVTNLEYRDEQRASLSRDHWESLIDFLRETPPTILASGAVD